MKKFCQVMSIACLFIVISGCAARLVGVLAVEEVTFVRAAGVRVSAAGLVVESEAALASQIARTRIFRPTVGRAQLYTVENGQRKVFAELVRPNIIKWVKSGYEVTIPGRIYGVRGGLANVNV